MPNFTQSWVEGKKGAAGLAVRGQCYLGAEGPQTAELEAPGSGRESGGCPAAGRGRQTPRRRGGRPAAGGDRETAEHGDKGQNLRSRGGAACPTAPGLSQANRG